MVRVISLLLALTILFSFSFPIFAEDQVEKAEVSPIISAEADPEVNLLITEELTSDDAAIFSDEFIEEVPVSEGAASDQGTPDLSAMPEAPSADLLAESETSVSQPEELAVSSSESENDVSLSEDFPDTDSDVAALLSQSGNCGDNLTWSLSDNGVFTISGSGMMYDYSPENPPPWRDLLLAGQIREVITEGSVESIGTCAFALDAAQWAPAGIEKVTLSDSVLYIGNAAFNACRYLQHVSLSDNVCWIGGNAFAYCYSLENFAFPKNLKNTGGYAFTQTGLRDVVLPAGLTVLENHLFYGCTKLRSIVLPESLQAIASGAFIACPSLTEIDIPQSVETIASDSFNLCTGLQKITVSPGNQHFKSIDGVLFNIEETVLLRVPEGRVSFPVVPSGVTKIGDYAFYGCQIDSVSLPETVTIIGNVAFRGCINLKEVTIPNSVVSIGGDGFYGCTSLTQVSLSDSLRTTGGYVFAHTGIQNIQIPGSISFLENHIFQDCQSLTSVTIPDSIKKIGIGVFQTCPSLAEVHYAGTEEAWGLIEIAEDNEALFSASLYCEGSAPSYIFTDVSDPARYYYAPVMWAVENHITTGYGGPNLFSPDVNCTREQIVTFLWRLMGEPEPSSYPVFSDVSSDKWYYKSICWAASQGITVGLNDGTGRFGVGQACTREMCVTFLWRAAGKPSPVSYSSFTDVAAGRYYYDAVSWAASQGITVGLNDGTGRFGIGQACTRAMIVTFLYRFSN